MIVCDICIGGVGVVSGVCNCGFGVDGEVDGGGECVCLVVGVIGGCAAGDVGVGVGVDDSSISGAVVDGGVVTDVDVGYVFDVGDGGDVVAVRHYGGVGVGVLMYMMLSLVLFWVGVVLLVL